MHSKFYINRYLILWDNNTFISILRFLDFRVLVCLRWLSSVHWLNASVLTAIAHGWTGCSYTAPVDRWGDRATICKSTDKNGCLCVQLAQCIASCLWLVTKYQCRHSHLCLSGKQNGYWERCVCLFFDYLIIISLSNDNRLPSLFQIL